MKIVLPFVPFAFCCILPAAAIEATLVTPEGDEQTVSLQEISESALILKTGSVALKDLAEILFASQIVTAQFPAALHLRNGDVLVNAEIVSGDDAKLSFKSAALGELALENKFLHAIVFDGKERPPTEALEAFLKAAPPKEDLLLTAKGQSVSGYLEKFTDKELRFNAGGQSRAYPFDQIAVFRLAPLDEYKPRGEFLGSIHLRDSSRITGKLTELKEKALKFEALNGQTWTVSADALSSIKFKGGKLAHLSDLTPKAVEEKPYIGGAPAIFHWRKDRSVTGAKLAIGGKEYSRGIGAHSYSKLVYGLNGQYVKFLCDVGIDNAASGAGSCAWKIVVDGKEAASGQAKPAEKAEIVKLEIPGARQLELICDYGPDDNDAGDHLDWANARLIRP